MAAAVRNNELKPEKMEMYEANHKLKTSIGRADIFNQLSAFHMKATDLITNTYNPVIAAFTTGNKGGHYTVNGIEQSATISIGKGSGFVGMGYNLPSPVPLNFIMSPSDPAFNPQDSDKMFRSDVAAFRAQVGAGYEVLPKLNAHLRVNYFGKVTTDAYAPDNVTNNL